MALARATATLLAAGAAVQPGAGIATSAAAAGSTLTGSRTTNSLVNSTCEFSTLLQSSDVMVGIGPPTNPR